MLLENDIIFAYLNYERTFFDSQYASTANSKELWKGSKAFLSAIEQGQYVGVTSITTLMELVHVFKIAGKEHEEGLRDLKKLGIHILVPDS